MYIFLQIISWGFQILPRNLALFLGRSLGSFIYGFIPLRKSIALKNLDIAFPEWDLVKKKATLHSCYRHYGMVLVDFFRLPKVKRNQDKNIVKISQESLKLFEKYSGGIIMSAHIGNWEYIGPSLGINKINCAGISKIQHNSSSNYFFNKLRSSKNVKIIPVDSGSKVMLDVIKNGYYLGLISDQNAGRKGTIVKFFNKPVSVPKGAGAFHLKTNTPILLGFCILSTDFNYHLSFHVLDVKELSDDSSEAIKQINQHYSKILEEVVRKYPKQYFWFHKKWDKENYQGLSK